MPPATKSFGALPWGAVSVLPLKENWWNWHISDVYVWLRAKEKEQVDYYGWHGSMKPRGGTEPDVSPAPGLHHPNLSRALPECFCLASPGALTEPACLVGATKNEGKGASDLCIQQRSVGHWEKL